MSNTQTQTLDYKIEFGELADTYGLFVPATINTGSQISADRIADESLRNKVFYTANVSLATKRNGKLLFGMGGNEAFNVVFGVNTQEACQKLIDTGYVHLTPAQKDLILMLEKSGDVVFVEPKDLGLRGQDTEYRKFLIRTESYQKDVTVARMPFVSAGYGSGYMLEKVMDNLMVNGKIDETTVFTMNPEHVAENVKDDEIVARASRLGVFDGRSVFDANVRSVDYRNALRGVLKNPAEGGAQNLVCSYTPEDVKKATAQVDKLKQLVRPECVQSLDDLLRKL